MREFWELFSAFFRIGILTFGGGLTMLPMLKYELVEKRKWITEEYLLDCYASVHLVSLQSTQQPL